MTSKPNEDFPIMSVKWTERDVRDFFQGSNKGSIFGYSDMFTFEQVQAKAAQYGVKVSVLPQSNPLRKKYKDYVLRVVSPYTPSTQKKVAHFGDIYSLELRTSLFNRECSGQDCSNTILKGVPFVEVTRLTSNQKGKYTYVKEARCPQCAKELVTSKVRELLRVLGHSEKSIDKHIKSISTIE